MTKKLTLTILGIVLTIAALLRLWGLTKVPVALFGDEVDVGYQAYSILKTGKDYYGNAFPIHFHSLAEWRTPLYLYSAVPTVAVFGISPLGVRLPAAVFGILGVLALYLLISELTGNKKLALVAAGVLALSPWHLQYSRAGFEVTEMLFFYIIGLWLFFKSLREGKWLWLSAVCLALTPWVYSTAKLFTPLLLVFLLVVYRVELLKLSKKYLLAALLTLVLVSGPIAYSTIFGGGTQRIGYISILTDPVNETEIGVARLEDARARGETGSGLTPSLLDRLIHNKFTYVSNNFIRNYFQPFSFDFLFNNGDPNPRHSIHQMGEFYKVEAVALILGLVIFFASKTENWKSKALIAFWVLAGVIPAAITRDGGNHATRLILILPPFVFLIAYGMIEGLKLIPKSYSKLAIAGYGLLLLICFGFYLHNYWVHNPTYSERWWHAGYKETFDYVRENQNKYDKVVISTAAEPPWVFFAGFYGYDPAAWQKNFPIGNDVTLPGLGKVSHIDKFYFGSYSGGLYDWGREIDSRTIYVASEKEVKVNLIMEPERTPGNLKLLRAVIYPSGEPALYIFSGK